MGLDLSSLLWPDADLGRQPQGASQIDFSNLVAKGLSACIDNYGRNLLDNAPGTVTQTKPVLHSKMGPVRGFGATLGQSASDLITTKFSRSSEERTYIFPYLIRAAGGGGFGRFWQKGVGATGSEYAYVYSTNSIGFCRTPKSGRASNCQFWSGAWGVPHVMALVCDGSAGGILSYLDGLAPTGSLGGPGTNCPAANDTDLFYLGNRADQTRAFDGLLGSMLVFDRALPAAEVGGIIAGFWKALSPKPLPFAVLSADSASMTGAAQAVASASGNLTLQASLEGAALAVSTAIGTLTTQIPMVGAAVSIASSAGNLATGIPLSGNAAAAALASGGLVAQIRLNGAALAQAAATAGLTSRILLDGAAQVEAAASGTLASDPGSLAGDATAQATVVATLTTSIRLSGTAAAQAGVSGILTTAIPLTAAALAQAIATGTLAVPILLTGMAKATASASGALTAPDSPATSASFRLNSTVDRVAHIACSTDRLTLTRASVQRLTTLTHEVQHV